MKGNRALAIAHISARTVQDRLDEVVGVDGWWDEYIPLPDGNMLCKLTIRIGDREVSKMDVGGPSEQGDGGDRTKASVSDALKRVAVKFGIGRYLYSLPHQWADYDPMKRTFVNPPQLPAWAVPKRQPPGQQKPPSSPAVSPSEAVRQAVPGLKTGADVSQPTAKPIANLPANGKELHDRLSGYEAKLAASNVCKPGALVAHVRASGVKAGYGDDITTWGADAIACAADWVKGFEATCRNGQSHRPSA